MIMMQKYKYDPQFYISPEIAQNGPDILHCILNIEERIQDKKLLYY